MGSNLTSRLPVDLLSQKLYFINKVQYSFYRFVMRLSNNISIIMKSICAIIWLVAAPCKADDPKSYFDALDNEAYLSWLELPSVAYDSSFFLPSSAAPESGVALHWSLDNDRIMLAVAARATGWVGFGISEAGK